MKYHGVTVQTRKSLLEKRLRCLYLARVSGAALGGVYTCREELRKSEPVFVFNIQSKHDRRSRGTHALQPDSYQRCFCLLWVFFPRPA